MKKVLLIPTYYYLSNPMYLSIQELLSNQGLEFIYFNTKDNILVEGNTINITKEGIGQNFNRYEELEYSPTWIRNPKNTKNFKENQLESGFLKCTYYNIFRYINKINNVINLMSEYKIYEKKIIEKVKEINPEFLIITSDMSISYRIIKKHFPHLKIIIIQPCFLDIRDKNRGKKFFIKKALNILSGGIMYPSQLYFGLESKNDKLLLFDSTIIDFYKTRRKNVFKIVNPSFYKLSQDVQELKSKDNRKKTLDKVNITNDNKIVIIFLSDYTLGHGEKVNNYIKEIYIKLIQTYSKKINFLIKNHPRIPLKDFDKNFINNENIIFLKEQLSFKEILSIGDLNISHNSNASLESLVIGMPTINLVPKNLSVQDKEQSKLLSKYGAYEFSTRKEIYSYFDNKLLDEEFFDDMSSIQKNLIGNEDECVSTLMQHLTRKDNS